MSNPIFREAKAQDIPMLADIISTTEAWQRYNIDYTTAIRLLESMEDTIYVAEIGDQIGGFVTLRTNGVGNIGAYMRMIAVAEIYRGRELGRKLMDYISEIAFQKTPNLFLICSVDNSDARRFYEKVGFAKAGTLSNLVLEGHDEILYRKTTGPMY